MIALAGTVLLASLVGSVHCMAMCGPLVALYGGGRSLRLAAMHSLGRLATYVVLGAVGGVVGGALNLAGALVHVQHVATLIAGVIIVGGGVHAIGIARGWWAARAASGALFQRGLVQLRRKRPGARAMLAGTLTGLVPCGWLWAFVAMAAGTGQLLAGALVMGAFWLGTVPAMTGLVAIGSPILQRLRQRVPVLTACVLVAIGLVTLASRWPDAGASGVAAPHCHVHASMR